MSWQHIKREFILVLEPFRRWIEKRCNPVWFQIIGILSIVAAFFFFGKDHPYIAWFAVLLPFCGIPELILIGVWRLTITSFGRSLFNKRIDTLIMLGSIPLTWWLFGPTAAGMYFIGFISNHFGEKQTKETIL